MLSGLLPLPPLAVGENFAARFFQSALPKVIAFVAPTDLQQAEGVRACVRGVLCVYFVCGWSVGCPSVCVCHLFDVFFACFACCCLSEPLQPQQHTHTHTHPNNPPSLPQHPRPHTTHTPTPPTPHTKQTHTQLHALAAAAEAHRGQALFAFVTPGDLPQAWEYFDVEDGPALVFYDPQVGG